MSEAWASDDDLRAAHQRFAAAIPGYRMPVAYSAARRDGNDLAFAHLNRPGEVRPLPAVVLATVAGYSNATMTARLTADDLRRAITLLEPAEAATHMPHPNLWSWRELAANTSPRSDFVALFIADTADLPVDELDARFRWVLANR